MSDLRGKLADFLTKNTGEPEVLADKILQFLSEEFDKQLEEALNGRKKL